MKTDVPLWIIAEDRGLDEALWWLHKLPQEVGIKLRALLVEHVEPIWYDWAKSKMMSARYLCQNTIRDYRSGNSSQALASAMAALKFAWTVADYQPDVAIHTDDYSIQAALRDAARDVVRATAWCRTDFTKEYTKWEHYRAAQHEAYMYANWLYAAHCAQDAAGVYAWAQARYAGFAKPEESRKVAVQNEKDWQLQTLIMASQEWE